jgi:hypothetical protein
VFLALESHEHAPERKLISFASVLWKAGKLIFPGQQRIAMLLESSTQNMLLEYV